MQLPLPKEKKIKATFVTAKMSVECHKHTSVSLSDKTANSSRTRLHCTPSTHAYYYLHSVFEYQVNAKYFFLFPIIKLNHGFV